MTNACCALTISRLDAAAPLEDLLFLQVAMNAESKPHFDWAELPVLVDTLPFPEVSIIGFVFFDKGLYFYCDLPTLIIMQLPFAVVVRCSTVCSRIARELHESIPHLPSCARQCHLCNVKATSTTRCAVAYAPARSC